MSLKEWSQHQPVVLPAAEPPAYFPERPVNETLKAEIIQRAGVQNLDWAMGYGSQGTQDASRDSMFDVMVLVADDYQFHADNLAAHPQDYGRPHRPGWHAFLNSFGPNFYQTKMIEGTGETRGVKLFIISTENFIKGCSGTLNYPNMPHEGAFGMYVAGRIQKVALAPMYQRDAETGLAIESAINAARIDGVFFAMGFLPESFTYEELLKEYVRLSYRADVRIEKKGKVDALINNSREDYAKMLGPIIFMFLDAGLLEQDGDKFIKIKSLTKNEADLRLRQLREITFCLNYFKNPLTPGLAHAMAYALAKVKRSVQSYR